MPFTFAHPLAVVPIARTKLAFSALVVGAMSPDFEYLIRMRQSIHDAHLLIGLLVFCLPASLLMLWLWHGLLKRPLLELLPRGQQGVLLPYRDRFSFGSPKQFLLHCVAILIGAATHVGWDSFTHQWGWPVQQSGWMQELVIPMPVGEPIAPHKAMQYASSLGGMGLLLLIYWRRFRRRERQSAEFSPQFAGRVRLRICMLMVFGAVVPAAIYAALMFPPTDGFENLKAFTVRSIVVSNSILLWWLIGYAIWFRWKFGPATDRAGSA